MVNFFQAGILAGLLSLSWIFISHPQQTNLLQSSLKAEITNINLSNFDLIRTQKNLVIIYSKYHTHRQDINQLAEDLGFDWRVALLDANEFPYLAALFEIKAIPTLVVVKDNQLFVNYSENMNVSVIEYCTQVQTVVGSLPDEPSELFVLQLKLSNKLTELRTNAEILLTDFCSKHPLLYYQFLASSLLLYIYFYFKTD